MAKMVMPPARLETRPTDVPFTDETLAKISLFAQLKRKVSLDKYPGTLVVRRYRAGEVVCSQGEAGWTAFYCLTTADVLALREAELQAAPADGRQARALRTEVEALRQRVARPEPAPRRVATFYLTLASPAPARRQGLIERLVRRWRGEAEPVDDAAPASIPIDASTTIDLETRQAAIVEGDLFGERSCQYGTPRSATVLADGECYLLEMLRNILDQVQKDPAYKARLDDMYQKQVFQLHLRKLSLFADLTDEQFDAIRERIGLRSCGPGEVIYDEHERSDDVYLIRTGLVRVVKKASCLLAQDQVRDWKRLGTALRDGADQPGTPAGKVWSLLLEEARAAARAAAGARSLPPAERLALLHGLNGVLANRQLPDAKELAAVAKDPAFLARAEGFPEKRKDWADQDVRRYNRLVLEHVIAGAFRPYRPRVGPDCVVCYCSQGEFIGEAGALGESLRGETCVAHGHPKDVGTAQEAGPVELVRIPGGVFAGLIEASAVLRRKVERKIAERRRQTWERVRVPVWDDSRQVLLSESFEQLGLIQGQRLMLVDLDRCTRCDECVRACVATHADGCSRLYLDGPRFGRYLVPTTCRSCLDPVCMIGCPVGSIHRGDNGQMVIEDWCIGCGLCAQQCPYGSIRMDDIGIIAETARGWRYLPLSAAGSDGRWVRPRYQDGGWLTGPGPFRNDRAFRESLGPFLKADTLAGKATRATRSVLGLAEIEMTSPAVGPGPVGQPVCFRREFDVPREAVRGGSQFRLEVTAPDPLTRVWVNGVEVRPADKPGRGGKREYWFPPKPPAPERGAVLAGAAPPPREPASRPMLLCAGRNLLAVSVSADAAKEGAFLTVRLDEVRKPKVLGAGSEEVTQKPVLERAVVCDLCSSQLGQVPACVNACPHDAALRVDARVDFPVT
jgi:Fe-S-cluster-containing hydrogenase component 2/CRP-like cAMP-binding protein